VTTHDASLWILRVAVAVLVVTVVVQAVAIAKIGRALARVQQSMWALGAALRHYQVHDPRHPVASCTRCAPIQETDPL
jgi:hypothetical protein